MHAALTVLEPTSPVSMGYRMLYHPGEVNRCPGCARSQWLVGRGSAQCAFCGTAMALALAAPSFRETPEPALQ